jgi:hypothetical protein
MCCEYYDVGYLRVKEKGKKGPYKEISIFPTRGKKFHFKEGQEFCGEFYSTKKREN